MLSLIASTKIKKDALGNSVYMILKYTFILVHRNMNESILQLDLLHEIILVILFHNTDVYNISLFVTSMLIYNV
jgi:hypothetical protein